MAIQSIKTRYKGCQFRSRLEARWAVFFDSLSIIWEYEKEGFRLSEGTLYLPDFWLPELDCFFEVKGSEPTDREKNVARQLSAEAHKLVVIASGTMNVEELKAGDISYGDGPAKGFAMTAYGGAAHHMWEPKAFSFGLWDWLVGTDLPPFIASEFSTISIPNEDSESTRELIIRLDQQYYFNKYGKEHPRYQWGRSEKNISWCQEDSRYQFGLEPDRENLAIRAAYASARGAQFEFKK